MAEKEAQAPTEQSTQSSASTKRKKVCRLTLAEIEQKIKTAQEKMGGLRSDFGRHLLAQKKTLTDSVKRS